MIANKAILTRAERDYMKAPTIKSIKKESDVLDASRIGLNLAEIEFRSGILGIRHWNTDIVLVDKDMGLVSLDNGGFYSVTTKKHMNSALNIYAPGHRIVQRAGNWYLICPDGSKYNWSNSMRIHKSGNVSIGGYSETPRLRIVNGGK